MKRYTFLIGTDRRALGAIVTFSTGSAACGLWKQLTGQHLPDCFPGGGTGIDFTFCSHPNLDEMIDGNGYIIGREQFHPYSEVRLMVSDEPITEEEV